MKLELLTNATVVDNAARFITTYHSHNKPNNSEQEEKQQKESALTT
jgi:hypothetical protein